jgi:hypothetical protein
MTEYQQTVEELLQQIDAKRQKLYRAEAAGARVPEVERKLAGTRERLASVVTRAELD